MARGRKPGFRMPDEHRHKIANSNVLTYLIQHVEGKREMTSTQVTAGIALLRKVMPDMSESAIESNVTVHHTSEAAGEFARLVSTVAQRAGAGDGSSKPH